METSVIADYIKEGCRSAIPLEVIKNAKPIDIVAFSSFKMYLLGDDTSDDFEFNPADNILEFSGNASEYPNLQLVCLAVIVDGTDVIYRCRNENNKNIFKTPCPEIAKIWKIIKKSNLYGLNLCHVLTNLGLEEPELKEHIDIFNHQFLSNNQPKSARNV